MFKTHNAQRTTHNAKGFTLIELMLVVIIISVLAAMVMPKLAGRSEEARKAAAKADINSNLALALDMYELDMGGYPAQLSGLWVNPGAGDKWKGPYLKKKEPKDPWGRDYVYEQLDGGKGYKLYSKGPDESKKDDDISSE